MTSWCHVTVMDACLITRVWRIHVTCRKDMASVRFQIYKVFYSPQCCRLRWDPFTPNPERNTDERSTTSEDHYIIIQDVCVPVSSGETCPQNGRSPGSISTQHSSPRSDFNSGNFSNSGGVPQNPAPNTTPSQPSDTPASLASDVIIQRKETEGFGFVIISSLNRPETAPAAG